MAATASAQRAHIDTVMQVAGHGIGAPQAQAHDEIIRASWQRCVHQHRLDPTRMQEAVILPVRACASTRTRWRPSCTSPATGWNRCTSRWPAWATWCC
jgi:transcriptional regulator of acetoin/glycerol metabolism